MANNDKIKFIIIFNMSTTEPQVDEEFERWMKHFQQREFFTNNFVTLTGFTTLGAAAPVAVNLIQLRRAYYSLYSRKKYISQLS